MASTPLTAVTAASTSSLVSRLGINTHIDFAAYGYENLTVVANDINYLGVKIIRDSAQSTNAAQTWLQLAQATGAKFDDYIGEVSPAAMQTNLDYMRVLAQEGILAAIEGGNEEDAAYAIQQGNSLALAAQFQPQVYALGQQLGLPVINMSFGAGWTAANNWQGNYDKVGDLSAYTTYANAHTYPIPGQLPDDTIKRLDGLANIAASNRPVVTTEIGWDTSVFDQQTIAKYALDAVMDAAKDGSAGMYFYAMFDDMSGNWGMFNADGTPRPSAIAVHNLTTLLADTGSNAATFQPGSLTYSLSGIQTGDNSYLFEKSDGSYWLSLWNETEASNSPHTVTVSLGGQATSVIEYDPLTGTSSIQSWSNVSTVQLSLPDHPVLLKIITSASGGSTGTPAPTPTPDPTPVPPPPPPPTLTGPLLTVPASASVTAGTTATIGGVSITDSFAASAPGTMALNLSAGSGLLTLTDANGNKAAGSGTHAITFNGTLAQLTTELAHLSYTAGNSTGSDSITVDVWDQAGLEATKSIAVNVAAAAAPPPPPPPPTASGPVITAPATVALTSGTTASISGVSVTDAFAASNPGSMILNVTASSGNLVMVNSSGSQVSGSGTHAISFTGSLAQISYDLAHLSYTAGTATGSDAISIDVWDQAGLEAIKSIAVSVTAPPTTTTPPPTSSTIKIAAGDAQPVINASHVTISATAGDHMIFIGGSFDVLTATGGTETVQAFQGNNTITTGKGNDHILIANSGNVINAGTGTNQIDDSGRGNTIILPRGGQGLDSIFGPALQTQDIYDLRSMLAGTTWNHSAATLRNYVSVSSVNGADAVISVRPGGTASSTHYNVAILHGTGPVSLDTLLAHSLT